MLEVGRQYYRGVPFKPPVFQLSIRKIVNARRMKFLAYEGGTKRILFCDLEIAASAVLRYYRYKKENATPQQ
jgi:hypothetical protein